MGARYTGRILDYQGEGSPDSYGYVQIYELKVSDPDSFLKAHKNWYLNSVKLWMDAQ